MCDFILSMSIAFASLYRHQTAASAFWSLPEPCRELPGPNLGSIVGGFQILRISSIQGAIVGLASPKPWKPI